jgi:hypothetical protein
MLVLSSSDDRLGVLADALLSCFSKWAMLVKKYSIFLGRWHCAFQERSGNFSADCRSLLAREKKRCNNWCWSHRSQNRSILSSQERTKPEDSRSLGQPLHPMQQFAVKSNQRAKAPANTLPVAGAPTLKKKQALLLKRDYLCSSGEGFQTFPRSSKEAVLCHG